MSGYAYDPCQNQYAEQRGWEANGRGILVGASLTLRDGCQANLLTKALTLQDLPTLCIKANWCFVFRDFAALKVFYLCCSEFEENQWISIGSHLLQLQETKHPRGE